MRYEARRAIFHPAVHVIVREGDFMAVPDKLRSLGPWQMLAVADFSKLKPAYRLEIASVLFVVIYTPSSEFAPEYPESSAVVIYLDDRRRAASRRT
jgi:hypothetical protein